MGTGAMRAPILAVAVLVVAGSASAQQVTLDLGFVNSSGNANFTSLNLGDKLSDNLGLYRYGVRTGIVTV